MKKNVISCIVLSILSCSCATIQNNIDKEQKDAVYAEIQNEINKLDAFECRDWLANYIAGSTYITAKYWGERGVNRGTLVIHSPIRASANLHIKRYKYRKAISDPREIYYLLHHMQSIIQFEAKATRKTETTVIVIK